METSVKNADALRQLFQRTFRLNPDKVRFLANQDATLSRITEELKFLAHSMHKEDSLAIYFAGYSIQDLSAQDTYWIPTDGNRKGKKTWLKHSRIKNIISRGKVRSRSATILVDSLLDHRVSLDETGSNYDSADSILKRIPEPIADSGSRAFSSKIENSAETLIVFGEAAEVPKPLAMPLPYYTNEARKARTEGIIRIQFIVRKDGMLERFRVIRGLDSGLNESTLHTIASQWRFRPGQFCNLPVDMQILVETSFRLY